MVSRILMNVISFLFQGLIFPGQILLNFVILNSLSIFSILLSYYIYISTKPQRILDFRIQDQLKYSENINDINLDLKKIYDTILNKNDVRISRIILWNAGKEPIRSDTDIVKENGLRFVIDENYIFFYSKIIYTKNKHNGFSISQSKIDREIFVNFNYIEPFEGIVIQVLHSGPIENIKMEGRIIGSTSPNIYQKRIYDFFMNGMVISLLIILIIYILELSIFAIYQLNLLTNNLDSKVPGSLVLILFFGSSLLIVYLIGNIYHKIYKDFPTKYILPKNVPSKHRGMRRR